MLLLLLLLMLDLKVCLLLDAQMMLLVVWNRLVLRDRGRVVRQQYSVRHHRGHDTSTGMTQLLLAVEIGALTGHDHALLLCFVTGAQLIRQIN